MKRYPKILLLVALIALILLLSACSRSVSKAPVASPTPPGEAPFPFTTPDALSAIKTQTAVALNPELLATNTPQVILATVEPTAAPETVTEPGTTDTTGATDNPDTSGATDNPEAAPATDTEAGGGISAPPPAEDVSIPEITRPSTYTIQKGEWLVCIARRYDLDLGSFLSANGMTMDSKPGVGTVLQIPSSGNWSSNYGARSLQAHPTNYSVRAGETVNGIACKFGDVSPEQILAANGLSSAADVQSGMNIRIP